MYAGHNGHTRCEQARMLITVKHRSVFSLPLTDRSPQFTTIIEMSATSPALRSRDGWEWTKQGGLQQGVPSIGVIQPASKLPTADFIFDVIVVGAGYAGLTAARDATLAGMVVFSEYSVNI
jgi:hypothetical protein